MFFDIYWITNNVVISNIEIRIFKITHEFIKGRAKEVRV